MSMNELSSEICSYDEDQLKIITASYDARILVDAGPGTGKTAVACARVSSLIDDQDINASHILFISFTRTAVQEIRNRIRSYVNNPGNADIIKIATIDSTSWMINQGFNEEQGTIGTKGFPTYEENIEKVRKLLNRRDIVDEILFNIDHLIIDEAQDIIGVRAKLILTIIKKLKGDCGVTVFSDDAQSIYGFAIDEEKKDEIIIEKPLPDLIRIFNAEFFGLKLKKVYRTDSPVLLKIFTNVRQDVLNNESDSLVKIKKVREILKSLSEELEPIDLQQFVEPDNTFVLYRRRAEVLTASSFLKERPHRIRMSGLPQSIHPWIGLCLSEFTDKSLNQNDFFTLWEEAIKKYQKITKEKSDDGYLFSKTLRGDDAWGILYRIAGSHKKINMNYLRQRLSTDRPPFEVITPEIGNSGPIIGTIHASKGREANYVHLMIPKIGVSKKVDSDKIEEETRVLFVGATRARKDLKVGSGYVLPGTYSLESGRVFRDLNKNGRICLEIGRDGDINAEGIGGLKFFSDASLVLKNKEKLVKEAKSMKSLTAHRNYDKNNSYSICFDDSDNIIGFLSDNIKWEFKSIIDNIKDGMSYSKIHYPQIIPHIRMYGIRTLVLPNGSDSQQLHEPWSESGFILAPVISGFPQVYFS